MVGEGEEGEKDFVEKEMEKIENLLNAGMEEEQKKNAFVVKYGEI